MVRWIDTCTCITYKQQFFDLIWGMFWCMAVSFFCMEVLHGVDFVFKEINSRGASVNLSSSKQTTVSRCFVPNMSPFWVSMVVRDWSQGNMNTGNCYAYMCNSSLVNTKMRTSELWKNNSDLNVIWWTFHLENSLYSLSIFDL